jgi:hypothetical protein
MLLIRVNINLNNFNRYLEKHKEAIESLAIDNNLEIITNNNLEIYGINRITKERINYSRKKSS